MIRSICCKCAAHFGLLEVYNECWYSNKKCNFCNEEKLSCLEIKILPVKAPFDK